MGLPTQPATDFRFTCKYFEAISNLFVYTVMCKCYIKG